MIGSVFHVLDVRDGTESKYPSNCFSEHITNISWQNFVKFSQILGTSLALNLGYNVF